MSTTLIELLGIIVLVAIIVAYNKCVKLRNYVREAFSTMDVYLKKRWDLIPNLIETVNAYAAHEKGVLTKIADLRSQNYSEMDDNKKMDINSNLALGLSKLAAVVENYPDLKANQTYDKLMQDLTSIENDIAHSRNYYNGSVREYNSYIETFPINIIASVFKFKEAKMFEITDKERQNVKVEL